MRKKAGKLEIWMTTQEKSAIIVHSRLWAMPSIITMPGKITVISSHRPGKPAPNAPRGSQIRKPW